MCLNLKGKNDVPYIVFKIIIAQSKSSPCDETDSEYECYIRSGTNGVALFFANNINF
jgi:hypothetical protein